MYVGNRVPFCWRGRIATLRVGLDALDAARLCNSNHGEMRDEGPYIRATPRPFLSGKRETSLRRRPPLRLHFGVGTSRAGD